MLTFDKKCTRGIAEGPGAVVVSTAGGLRLHPVKIVIQPGGGCVGNGCAKSKSKSEGWIIVTLIILWSLSDINTFSGCGMWLPHIF